ncbi:MAG TPA: amino acid adenylation domain-containing protein [Bacteroidia bacterium]|nr:amino acid adenylation domain-containing protein [Bacteroidia bacterium]HRS58831.1 amino acid adenylation domain-containing protein [Bacteroidia bacterium]HRU67738.1 amino acid adenylation domain-containing protein [Bacteroidia bacterium]
MREYQSVEYNPFAGEDLPLWCPLTESQKEIWYSTLLGNDANCAYNECIGLDLYGELNVSFFEEAVRKTFLRHDSLRAFFDVDGEKMFFSSDSEIKINYIDFSGTDEEQQQFASKDLLNERVLTPFELSQYPLFRIDLITFSPRHHLFILTIHHIICDGWSLGVIVKELSQFYTAMVKEQDLKLPPASQFYTFSHETEVFYDSPEFQQVENFWLRQFEHHIPILDLPVEFPRPTIRTFKGNRVDILVPDKINLLMKNTALRYNVTYVNLMLALFEAFLSRITGQQEILVGLPAASQAVLGKYDLVGHCVNLLPVLSKTDDQSFENFLAKRKKYLIEALDNQRITFGRLLKKLKIERDFSRVPFIPAVFNVDMGIDEGVYFEGITHKLVSNPRKAENFELFLNITGSENEVIIEFSYNISLFSEERIRQMAEEFLVFCRSACENPSAMIHELDILPEWEKKLVTEEWCCRNTDYPRDKTVHQLFEEIAAQYPDKIALVEEGKVLTYRELNEKSNQLAHFLISLGIRPASQIAVCLHSSFDLIISVLAVLKTGSTYVPVPTDYPEFRLKHILEETRLNIFIKTKAFQPEILKNIDYLEINTDELPDLTPFPVTAVSAEADPLSHAYVMFTSGSTGEPKGVCIPHRAIVRLVKNTDYIEFTDDLVFLQASNIGFDASTFEIWGSLLNGCTLVLMPSAKKSLSELADAIVKNRVNVLWLTSGLFSLMVDHEIDSLTGLKYLLAGGDVLSVPHVLKALGILGPGKIINGYGPTENTTFTTTFLVNEASQIVNSVPIGKPVCNSGVYILDNHLHPVPVGVKGELYTGGDGLALCYLNNPELTAKKFIPNPFSSDQKDRLYKTGDIVRWRSDGNIEFISRYDEQVKIRGFRVEPNEIEKNILQFQEVLSCAVLVKGEDAINKKLIAYVVFKNKQANENDLREYLATRLPDYMIPSLFVRLDKLPLNEQGKVDKNSLLAEKVVVQEKGKPIASVSKIEKKISEIWMNHLGINEISITDNFFHLGGNSLVAVQILAEIEKHFFIKLPLAVFFENSTIRSLAKVVASKAEAVSWQPLVPLNAKGTKTPLFLVHGAGMNVVLFEALAKNLSSDQPVYALQAKGLDGKSEPPESIQDMASYYISQIIQVCPEGPYSIAGYSLGGYIAYEMAQQLTRMEKEVRFLSVFDTDSYINGFYFIPENAGFLQKMVLFLFHHFSRIIFLSGVFFRQPLHFLAEKKRVLAMKFKQKRYARLKQSNVSQVFENPMEKIEQAGIHALSKYEIQEYQGDLYLFKAKNQTYYIADSKYYGWKRYVKGNVYSITIPGDHADMFSPPNDAYFASVLQDCLNQVNKKKHG